MTEKQLLEKTIAALEAQGRTFHRAEIMGKTLVSWETKTSAYHLKFDPDGTLDSAMIYDHKAQRAHTLAKYTYSLADPSLWKWGYEGWLDTSCRFDTLDRQLGVRLTDGSDPHAR